MKPKVLIIEDDNDILDILKLTFEDEDYEIIGYNKVPELSNILSIFPSVIILDVRLFGSIKSGDMLCRKLKAEFSTMHIPVILLSAEHKLAQLAKECGADGYIVKPFDIADLKATVNYFIKGSHITNIPNSYGDGQAGDQLFR